MNEISNHIVDEIEELQQENKQLKKDYNKVIHEATEFESKVYELQEQLQQREIELNDCMNERNYFLCIIEKSIQFIKENAFLNDKSPNLNALGQKNTLKLLDILEKYKGDNND